MQTALSLTTGLFFVLVTAIAIVTAQGGKLSSPLTQAGLYFNEELGLEITFPKGMNKPGKLSSDETIFHVRHPEKTLFLKIRKSTIPTDQPMTRKPEKCG